MRFYTCKHESRPKSDFCAVLCCVLEGKSVVVLSSGVRTGKSEVGTEITFCSAMSSCKRTIIDEENLINLVESHPCLYNKTHKDYRDTYQKENIWHSIGRSLGCSKEEAKEKWTALRQRFSREKKQMSEETRSGAPGGSKKKWVLYDSLGFLEKHVVGRQTIGNLSSSAEIDQPYYSEDYEDYSVNQLEALSPMSDSVSGDEQIMHTKHPPIQDSHVIQPRAPKMTIMTKKGLNFPIQLSQSSVILSPPFSTPIEDSLSPLSSPTPTPPPPKHAILSSSGSAATPLHRGKKRRVETVAETGIDDDMNAVKQCLQTWRTTVETRHDKSEKNPEAAFGNFVALELQGFTNTVVKDAVKRKICDLIFTYKHGKDLQMDDL